MSYHSQLQANKRRIESAILAKIDSLNCPKDSTAVIVDLGEFRGDDSQEYYSRVESNGDLLVAIYRGDNLVTNFYRRSNQKNDCHALRVSRVVYA